MTPPQFNGFEVAVDGQVGQLKFNRPEKLNPLGTDVLAAIEDAARWFDTHRDLKVVVFSGEGRAFSAGADLLAVAGSEGAELTIRDRGELGARMANAIEAMRAVTVAKIHGYCIGGAVVLISACDFRVADANTKFSIPEVDLGIPLTWGGIPRLVREIGAPATRDLVMTCRQFDADEALRLGLIQRLARDGDLDAAVDELVEVLISKAALPLLSTKRSVDAITATMVGRDRSSADADGLVAAFQDDESRQAAARYVAGLNARRGGKKA